MGGRVYPDRIAAFRLKLSLQTTLTAVSLTGPPPKLVGKELSDFFYSALRWSQQIACFWEQRCRKLQQQCLFVACFMLFIAYLTIFYPHSQALYFPLFSVSYPQDGWVWPLTPWSWFPRGWSQTLATLISERSCPLVVVRNFFVFL